MSFLVVRIAVTPRIRDGTRPRLAARRTLTKPLPGVRPRLDSPVQAGTRLSYTAPVTAGEIMVDDPRKPEVRGLLERHLVFCLSETPPEHSFALNVDGLLDPKVTFVSFRDGDAVLGVAAIKELDADHAELKSMHTARAARRLGLGRAMLGHLIGVARERGYQLLSLETGSMDGFAPARALYASAGFTVCGPFASYPPSPHSTFMSLPL